MRSGLKSERKKFWINKLDEYEQRIGDHLSHLHWVDTKNTLQSIKKGVARFVDKITLPSFSFYLHALKDDKKLKGDSPQVRYNYFVRKYHDQFLADFPELEKALEVYLDGAISNIKKCLDRLNENKEAVYAKLDFDGRRSLQKIIIPDNGDRHLGGEQVLFLEFSNGRRIKYKPVDLRVNVIVEKVGNFLNSAMGKSVFVFPDGVYYSDHAFIGYKESDLKITSTAKAEELYYQNGCWLAFVYLLNGTDFHVENVLAQQSQLYLLDTETFFSNFSYGSGRFIENTLTTTGFVERISKNQPAMSGMFGGNKVYKSITDPFVVNDQTDNLQVRFVATSNFQPENQPKINNSRPAFAGHKDIVKQGFKDTYKKFNQNTPYIRNIVESNKNTTVRQVLRKTSLYSLIIQNIYQPKNWPLKNYRQEVEVFLESLNEDVRNVIDFEIQDLFNFDIPYFKSKLNSRKLYHGKEKLNNFFTETPLERWIEKLDRLGGYHLEKKVNELDRLLSQEEIKN
jgi:lantibiotic modifying enzyme